MARYNLRLFGRDGWSNEAPLGVLEFRAPDAGAAVGRARKLFPQRLDDCSYAFIHDEQGRLVWRKGESRSERGQRVQQAMEQR